MSSVLIRTQKWLPARCCVWCIVAALSLSLVGSVAEAANLARIIRQAAGVADEIPIRRLDEVVQEGATSRAGRELLEKLDQGRRLDDLVDESAAIRRAWKEALGTADSRVFREIDSLPPASQRAALVLAHGGRQLKSAVPDVALRSRIVREGGAETLAALGRFNDLADDAVRFDIALKSGKLPSPAGARALTLNDFGSFFHNMGDRGHRFWTQYVRPHWKLWLGTTALAAVLLAPDEFLDQMGNLTEKGMEKLGRIGGKVLASAMTGTIRGVATGTQEVVKETSRAIVESFFTSVSGVVSAVAIALTALIVIRPTRRWLLGGVCRIFASKSSAQSAPNQPTNP